MNKLLSPWIYFSTDPCRWYFIAICTLFIVSFRWVVEFNVNGNEEPMLQIDVYCYLIKVFYAIDFYPKIHNTKVEFFHIFELFFIKSLLQWNAESTIFLCTQNFFQNLLRNIFWFKLFLFKIYFLMKLNSYNSLIKKFQVSYLNPF